MNVDKVKAQLERHGFQSRYLECDGPCDGYSCNNCEPMWEVSYEGDGDHFDWLSQAPTEELAWGNAMTFVLADKSLTGARIADLIAIEEDSGHSPTFQVFLGCHKDCDYEPCDKMRYHAGSGRWDEDSHDFMKVYMGVGDTIDEVIASLWSKVFLEEE